MKSCSTQDFMRNLSWPVGIVACSSLNQSYAFATVTSLGCTEVQRKGMVHFVLRRNSSLLSNIKEGNHFTYSLLGNGQEKLAINFGSAKLDRDPEFEQSSFSNGIHPRTVIVKGCSAVLYLKFKDAFGLIENVLIFCEVSNCDIFEETPHLSYRKQRFT